MSSVGLMKASVTPRAPHLPLGRVGEALWSISRVSAVLMWRGMVVAVARWSEIFHFCNYTFLNEMDEKDWGVNCHYTFIILIVHNVACIKEIEKEIKRKKYPAFIEI